MSQLGARQRQQIGQFTTEIIVEKHVLNTSSKSKRICEPELEFGSQFFPVILKFFRGAELH